MLILDAFSLSRSVGCSRDKIVGFTLQVALPKAEDTLQLARAKQPTKTSKGNNRFGISKLQKPFDVIFLFPNPPSVSPTRLKRRPIFCANPVSQVFSLRKHIFKCHEARTEKP